MLLDTTLREGAQLFGAYFTIDTRKQILSSLLQVGVDEIELGWIGQSELTEFSTYARSQTSSIKLSVWSPCREADIRAVAKLPVDRINIGVPSSDLHIEKRLSTQREVLLERLVANINVAKECGIPYISVGLEDVSRADELFALQMALVAETHGASRVRLADSLGQLTPLTMAKLMNRFRDAFSIDIAVHCHDDFGMATANSITALECGADYADISVLGVGERSGIAATEELVAYLAIKQKDTRYAPDILKRLCEFVASAAHVSIPRTKAVVGTDVFACESGLHAHALSKSPELFEPYDLEQVGITRKIRVGSKSGRSAVLIALNEYGLVDEANTLAQEYITDVTKAVCQLSCKLERPLTEDELGDVWKETIHGVEVH
ncbi:LeuA family protein [Halodesulfovibrio aestuarii]|uniref:Homocitrate synthase NifV n=1 Tax=Halodesulfovibrio aestuarii TaxID=126333 RepID=A0A8G2C7F0_9BACT|nr:pyruvate carboxyltransferase [Halodesulfovibrio aestuarii]SHI62912.1 homocitrate synthase NifV [Halodesulfovibrio aestuarii]